MMNNNEFEYTKSIIDITPVENPDTTGQQEMENPIIIIESDEKGSDIKNQQTKAPKTKLRTMRKWLVGVLCLVVLVVGGYLGVEYYILNYYVGLPISCSPSDNIDKLEAHPSKQKADVIFTHDSVGTVAINMYELRGLKGEISFTEPLPQDSDVYFYSRCSDFGKDGRILGSMVVDGKIIKQGRGRLGYCAMHGDNTVIGISKSEKVRDYIAENGGYYFRQFVLVSDGEIPRVFKLHKKVERRALARMDDQLYYIESVHPETMWDFADAIRKYGFIDAIYITGGNCHSYYRTSDGRCHNIGMPESTRPRRIPWIVFKQR